METRETKAEFRFEGRHMLMIMLVFFGVIVSVNISMAVLAKSNWTGLVVKNSYVASQKYNDLLDQANAQRQSGLTSSIGYDNGVLAFSLNSPDGKLIRIDNAVAKIGRPAHEHSDRTLTLEITENGRLLAPLVLGQGVWAVSVTGQTGNLTYRRDARIFVGKNGVGVLE